MIKKTIKPFSFIERVYSEFNITGGTFVHTVGHTLVTTPNTWQVTLDNNNPQFILHGDGSANFTGRVHALGSVIYNTELQRLQYWSGTSWEFVM